MMMMTTTTTTKTEIPITSRQRPDHHWAVTVEPASPGGTLDQETDSNTAAADVTLLRLSIPKRHLSSRRMRRYRTLSTAWGQVVSSMAMLVAMCVLMGSTLSVHGFVLPLAGTTLGGSSMKRTLVRDTGFTKTTPTIRELLIAGEKTHQKSNTAASSRRLHGLRLQESKSSSSDQDTTTIIPISAAMMNVTNSNTTTSESSIASDYFKTPPPTSSPSQQQQQMQLQLKEWFQETLFLGIEPTPDVVAIATIYFVEGALGLARLAQTYLLKDELHLGPAELSALTGIFSLPWTIKPLYGFLSDGFPLWGYRRRSYLILAGLTGCFSYSLVGHQFWGLLDSRPDWMIPGTVAALVVSSACIAFSDVVADGIVVQKTRDSTDPKIAGGLQSLCWGSAAIGGLMSAYFSGSLLQVMKPQDIFAITAVLPFLVATIAFLINEKPQPRNVDIVTLDTASDSSTDMEVAQEIPGVQAQIDALWSAIKQPSIYKPMLFLFLWQSTPTSDGAMFFFMTEDLKFGPEFLGRVRVVTAIASLFGVWLYNQYLKTKPIKDILFWSSIISTPLGLLNLLLISHVNRDLGIPDTWFVFGDDVVLSVLGEIAFLPTLVLAARLCPPGVEAVLFATLMSINNGAGTLGTEIGAGLTKWLGVTESNFDNLALLSIICNLTSLYPLLFIGWLDEVGSVSEQDLEDEETMAIDTTAT